MHEVAMKWLAYQEYMAVKDELDRQIEAAYTRRFVGVAVVDFSCGRSLTFPLSLPPAHGQEKEEGWREAADAVCEADGWGWIGAAYFQAK
jgi:hypothetical protein